MPSQPVQLYQGDRVWDLFLLELDLEYGPRNGDLFT